MSKTPIEKTAARIVPGKLVGFVEDLRVLANEIEAMNNSTAELDKPYAAAVILHKHGYQ